MEKHNTMKTGGYSLKILVSILLTCISSMSLYAQDQLINLNLKNTTLSHVINEIKKQTDYQFFYEDQLAKTAITSVSVKNETLSTVLDKVLANTGISYTLQNKVVYLTGNKSSEPVLKSKTKNVSGSIQDVNGEPLIGVTIKVIGTTFGTISDLNGNFSVDVAEGQELRFSYIGYIDQVRKIDSQNTFNIEMKENINQIEEVVVTALGIKREKKNLGYAIQEVSGADLNVTGDPSVSTALQGKVAGVLITQSATGLGGSTKITIRGNRSISGSNEPLWVIDGIPFSDTQEGATSSLWEGYDRGGSAIDLNPEDIESISILKGANSAALYGSRAANGVIMVTTKKGVRKSGFGASYSGTFTWTDVAETLDTQTKYGQGFGGVYSPTSEFSWGPKLDGSEVIGWNGVASPYSYDGNKLKDYFQTGFSQGHNVSFGNTTEASNYRLGIGYSDNNGIFEGENLNKLSVDLRAGTTVNKYLSLDSKITLMNTNAENRPQQGKAGELYQLYRIPNNVRLSDLSENYVKPNGAQVNWISGNPDIQNPYHIRYRFPNKDSRMRSFGYASAKVNITNWLNFNAKQSIDYHRTKIENMDRGDGIGVTDDNPLTSDSYSLSEINSYELNSELLLIGDRNLNDKFRLGFTAGANFMHAAMESMTGSVRNLYQKGFWALSNVNEGGIKDVVQDDWERKTNSVFGSAQLAFNSFLALDLTGREDWSSTVPDPYFYPSVSLSYVFTDMLNVYDKKTPAWLSFAKFRASYARAGKDTEPQQNYTYYERVNKNGKIVPIYENLAPLGKNLKPEMTTSYEIGLDMKFFNNRLGFDFTAYYTESINQIMIVRNNDPNPAVKLLLPLMQINGGKISNKGLELMIYTTPVKTKDFQFDFDINLATNSTFIDELAANQYYYDFNSEEFFIRVTNFTGRKMGDIIAQRIFLKDGNGNYILRPGSGLLVDDKSDSKDRIIGNIQPSMIGSFKPYFNYKGISLSALFDFKIGGDIVSVTEAIATASGTAGKTADRDGNIVVKGVSEATGEPTEFSYSAENYYKLIGGQNGYAEMFVYDASFLRLKELSLSYSIPRKILKKTFISNMSISAVGRNLFYLFKNTPGSPEAGFNNSIFSQAIDYCSVPYARTYGISVNLGF